MLFLQLINTKYCHLCDAGARDQCTRRGRSWVDFFTSVYFSSVRTYSELEFSSVHAPLKLRPYGAIQICLLLLLLLCAVNKPSLIGNGSVSVWLAAGMHSTECPLVCNK